MRKILLTGATGFVGYHMPRFLCDLGGEVHTIGRRPSEATASTVFHAVDLLSLGKLSFDEISAIGADTLIHTAWCTQPGVYWNSVENLRWTAASMQLFDAFLSGGGKRFIGVGSCAEYDWQHDFLVEHKTTLAPSTVYGQAKASLHALLASYATKHELSFAWAHVFFPYGPREKQGRLLSDLFLNLLAGFEMPVSEATQVRDFMYIDDVAEAIARLALSDVQGSVNIASGDARPLKDIISMAARAVGRQDLVKFGARPPILNDPPRLAASVERLQMEVGFQPRYGLEQGIKATADWWKTQFSGDGYDKRS